MLESVWWIDMLIKLIMYCTFKFSVALIWPKYW